MTTVVKNGWETVENIEEVRADIKVCTNLCHSVIHIFTGFGGV